MLTKSRGGKQLSLLNIVMQLKKLCNHARLLEVVMSWDVTYDGNQWRHLSIAMRSIP